MERPIYLRFVIPRARCSAARRRYASLTAHLERSLGFRNRSSLARGLIVLGFLFVHLALAHSLLYARSLSSGFLRRFASFAAVFLLCSWSDAFYECHFAFRTAKACSSRLVSSLICCSLILY